MGPGIFQDACPRSEISGNPSYHYENKFLQNDNKDSILQAQNPAALASHLMHVPYYFLYYFVSIRRNTMPNSVNSRRELRKVLFEPSREAFENVSRCTHRIPCYRAAIENRGQAFLWDLECSRVGWERGMHQNCSLFQDRKNSLALGKEINLFC